jgi:hypothetical protein
MPPSLNDRTYIAKRDALKRKTRTNDLPCWLCGETNWDWDNWKAQLAFTADTYSVSSSRHTEAATVHAATASPQSRPNPPPLSSGNKGADCRCEPRGIRERVIASKACMRPYKGRQALVRPIVRRQGRVPSASRPSRDIPAP